MKKPSLFPIIFTISLFQITLQQCIYNYPLTTSSKNQCNNQYQIDSSQSTFPSQWTGTLSTKKFSFDLQMQVIGGACSTTPTDKLFILQIDDGGTPFTPLYFSYSQLSTFWNYDVAYADDGTSGSLVSHAGQYDINVNTQFEVLVSIDLTFGSGWMDGYLAYREAVISSGINIGTKSYWKFDSSTKIFLCSDASGIPNYYCSIDSFNYWFTNPSIYLSYIGQLTRIDTEYTPLLSIYLAVLLASYLFGEGSGYKLGDSATLGAAYLGASTATTSDTTNSPTWLYTEVGVEFTSTAQYVSIKPFQLASQASEYDMGSFTISLWIRFTLLSANGGNIFQYGNYDMSHVYFLLHIGGAGYLNAKINSGSVISATQVPSDVWTLVAITFVLHPLSAYQNFIMIFIEGSPDTILSVPPSTPMFAYNPRNIVRIGGFKGSIYDFRIYTPGSSIVMNKASCSGASTNCLLSLGKLTSNQCLTKPAVTCHSSCKTCFDKTAQGCLSCYPEFHISYTQCVSDNPTAPTLSPATTETIKGSQKAAQAATQAVNAVTAGSPSGVSAAIGGKIFFNIKFLNITYAENLEEALNSWGSSFISLGLTPDLPSSITNQIPNENLPYVFTKREVFSSFLRNFWESLGMVLFVIFIFLTISTLEWLVKKFKDKYPPHHLLFAIRAVIQNFLLAQLYSVFGDILFFASLEFRAPNTHHKWSRLSLATGIILLFFMTLILLYHVHLLLKYQYIRKYKDDNLAQFENENKGSSVLFSEFKDISFARQSFLFFLTARDLVFSLFLSLMFEHPLAECIFILILNVAMVAYLLLLPPFKSALDAAQQLFYEIVTLAVNVSVLILAIMDDIESPDDTGFRSKIGRFVIVVNMVFNFGSLAFMLVKAFCTIYKVYKAYKERKNKKKVDLKLQIPHRFVQTQQEVNPELSLENFKNKLSSLEAFQFEHDQSTIINNNKPFDQTNESFLINREFSPQTFKTTPKFETTPYAFDKSELDFRLDQVEEENFQKSPPSTMSVSPFDYESEDPAEALKAILRKNEETKQRMILKAQLKELAVKNANTKTIQKKK